MGHNLFISSDKHLRSNYYSSFITIIYKESGVSASMLSLTYTVLAFYPICTKRKFKQTLFIKKFPLKLLNFLSYILEIAYEEKLTSTITVEY